MTCAAVALMILRVHCLRARDDYLATVCRRWMVYRDFGGYIEVNFLLSMVVLSDLSLGTACISGRVHYV